MNDINPYQLYILQCSFHLDREAEVKVVYLREIQRPEKAGRLEKNQEKTVF